MILKVYNLIIWVNETKYLLPHELCQCKCELHESVWIYCKQGIIMNVGVSVKSEVIAVLVKKVRCGILVDVILNVIKHVKCKNIF